MFNKKSKYKVIRSSEFVIKHPSTFIGLLVLCHEKVYFSGAKIVTRIYRFRFIFYFIMNRLIVSDEIDPKSAFDKRKYNIII